MPVDLLAEKPRRQPRDLLAQEALQVQPQGIPQQTFLENREPGMMEGIGNLMRDIGLPVDRMGREAQTVDDLARLGASGASLGFADKIAGALGGGGAQAESERTASARERTGAAGTAAELVGAVATPGAAMRQGATIAGRFGTRAMEGGKGLAARTGLMGAEGAGYGAATAAGHDQEVGTGALIGAGAGVGGNLVSEIASPLIGRIFGGRASDKVPSVERLKNDAGRLYDAAEATGAVAPSSATKMLNNQMRTIATDEGIISPSGKIAEYPKIRHVLDVFEDYSASAMTVPQMKAARKSLQAALKSGDAEERRIAYNMLDKFDEVVDQTVPQLKGARELWSKAKKGDLIETAVELAGARAGQFSGSGFENALRTEFRALERQIIKGQLKGLSGAEKTAIIKAARGTTTSNIARGIGKAAPTGVVSAGISGGMPFLVGNAIGGPALGGALSLGTMGAGAIGRGVATKMGTRNAEIASALMRGGDPSIAKMQQGLTPEQRQKLARMLMGSGVFEGVSGR